MPGDLASDGLRTLQGFLDAEGAPWRDAKSLDRARWRLAVQGAQDDTNLSTAQSLFNAWKLGLSPAAFEELAGHLATIGLPDIDEAIRACRGSAVISVRGPTAP